MMIEDDGQQKESLTFMDMTAAIVAAYVSNNHISIPSLPSLIQSVHETLRGLGHGAGLSGLSTSEPSLPTAAQIQRSIGSETLTSFIDGRPYRTLKRHLNAHGFSPQSYRAQFGLPADYPMVSSGYAARRSALAKAIGLGVPGAQAVRAAAE